MSFGKVKMKVSPAAAQGDWVTVKALVIHPQKLTKDGKPEHVVTRMVGTYQGKTVVECELGGAISQNPLVAFRIRATKPGEVKAVFKDNQGKQYTGTANVNIG